MSDPLALLKRHVVSLVAVPLLLAVLGALAAQFAMKKHHMGLLHTPELADIVKREVVRKPLADAAEVNEVLAFFKDDKEAVPFRVSSVDVIRGTESIRVVTEGWTAAKALSDLDEVLKALAAVYKTRIERQTAFQREQLAALDKQLAARAADVAARRKRASARGAGEGAAIEFGLISSDEKAIESLQADRELLDYCIRYNEQASFRFISTRRVANRPARMAALAFMLGLALALGRLALLQPVRP